MHTPECLYFFVEPSLNSQIAAVRLGAKTRFKRTIAKKKKKKKKEDHHGMCSATLNIPSWPGGAGRLPRSTAIDL